MDDDLKQGRLIGAAMAAGFVIELVSNFKLQPALTAGGDLLAGPVAAPQTVGLLITLGLLATGCALFVAALLAARYGPRFPALAWTYFGLTVAALAGTLVELSGLHAMRFLGEARAHAGPEGLAAFAATTELVHGVRKGVHLCVKLLEGGNVLAFYALLWQARVVPRALAGAGLVAALLQMSTVGAPLYGGQVDFLRLAPLGLVYLATFGWLLVRGLPAYRPPVTSSTAPVV